MPHQLPRGFYLRGHFREPEGHWFGLSKRARVFIYDKAKFNPAGFASVINVRAQTEGADAAIADTSVHTLVIRGRGRHFCTGFDLSGLETGKTVHMREIPMPEGVTAVLRAGDNPAIINVTVPVGAEEEAAPAAPAGKK